jgi:PAS domain S-box-containing protein
VSCAPRYLRPIAIEMARIDVLPVTEKASGEKESPLEAKTHSENVQLPMANDNLLRTVIDNLPHSIFAKDTEDRFLMANTTLARIMGIASPDELVGHTDSELLGPEIAQRYHVLDERVIRHGEELIDIQETSSDSAGNLRWDLTTKVPLRDGEGKIRGLVAISRDITAQKLAEHRLLAANEELSRGHEELLDALSRLRAAHEELRSAQSQLVEAEKFKSIGRLAVGVAHEVKNPLAIAFMGLDFISQESFPKDSLVPIVLEEMRNALCRADVIVRGLLDFSEPKHLDLDLHDLNAIIGESFDLLRGELAGSEITIERDLQADLPALPLDRDKIGQVFISLLTNAIHAMNGSGCLSVRTRREQLTGVGPNVADSRSENFRVGDFVVIVHVDDTGPGIPEEKLMKVFEPFYTTKPTGKGTGLGLAVAKTIIDLHGGTIQMHNRPEGGLRVEMILKT